MHSVSGRVCVRPSQMWLIFELLRTASRLLDPKPPRHESLIHAVKVWAEQPRLGSMLGVHKV